MPTKALKPSRDNTVLGIQFALGLWSREINNSRKQGKYQVELRIDNSLTAVIGHYPYSSL